MKKGIKKGIAYLLCLAVLLGTFGGKSLITKASQPPPGDISFTIGDGGKVEYSTDGASFTEVEGTLNFATSNPSVTTVYLKAIPSDGKRIDPNNQCVNRYDDQDYEISVSGLADGSYSFSYDKEKVYAIRIGFDNAQGGEPSSDIAEFQVTYDSTYTVLGQDVSVALSNGETAVSSPANIVLDQISSYKFTLTGFAAASMEAKLQNTAVDDDYTINLTVTDQQIDLGQLQGQQVKEGMKLIIQAKNNPNDYEHNMPLEGTYRVNMQVDPDLGSFTPSLKIEFLDSADGVLVTKQLSASQNDMLMPQEAKKLKITIAKTNIKTAYLGSDKYQEIDLFDVIRNAAGDSTDPVSITYDIDITAGYELRFEFSNKRNVSWSYDSQNAQEDQLVENARIELVNVSGTPIAEGQTDHNLTIGETYYFKLIPDYGYQISGIEINGYTLTPMTQVGMFQFTMQDFNFHFKGIVTPASDQVTKRGDIVGGAAIEDIGEAAVTGNLKLTVDDAEEDWTALSHAADGSELFGTVDIMLEQIISKGTQGNYWTTNLTELSDEVELSLDVPAEDLAEGQTYSIVRKHGQDYEPLTNAVFNSSTGKLTFRSKLFSEYTIIKVPGTPEQEAQPRPAAPTVRSGKGGKSAAASQYLGTIPGEKPITSWTDLEQVIVKKATDLIAKPQTSAGKDDLVKIILKNNATTVPVTTFAKLATTGLRGIHFFTGNGTALTFLNDGKLPAQQAINVACVTKSYPGRKEILFASADKLQANVELHAAVPVGTKLVSVYFTDGSKQRRLIGQVVPTKEGRLCFAISQLGKYELEW